MTHPGKHFLSTAQWSNTVNAIWPLSNTERFKLHPNLSIFYTWLWDSQWLCKII